jgi:hypothetical protein
MTLVPAPFIVGVGRSGTTLLRMMLDAHPDLAIPPETGFLPEVPPVGVYGLAGEWSIACSGRFRATAIALRTEALTPNPEESR